MLLVRKPKHDMYGNGGYNDHYRRDHHDVNANNNAFILNEEEERQQQRYIKDHYSNKRSKQWTIIMKKSTIHT